MIRTRIAHAALAAVLATVPACSQDSDDPTGPGGSPYYPDAGSYGPPPPPPPPPVGGGDFGATQGGVQDMQLARELIAAGNVPPPEAFVVEGMFSEHDLPVDGPACDTLFCLRGAMAVAPTLDGELSGWMQVGLSSTIDPATFERPSVTVIATVDVSGSMGWGYQDGESPGEVSRHLLERLSLELGAEDRIAIVTYGSAVNTPLPLTRGDDREAIAAVIAGLDGGGWTNMEAGLQQAYALAKDAAGGTDQTRIVLFTDVQPNVGATTATEFEQMVEDGASAGVGISVMAMGLGLGQELMNAMSHVRGGNAFSFFDTADVDTFLEDNWPWFVSPIAYDMSMHVAATSGFAIADAYGFPAPEGAEVSFDVSTVFLSKRRGALLLRVTPPEDGGPVDGGPVDGGAPAASFPPFLMVSNLAYTNLESTRSTERLEVEYTDQPLDDRGHYYEQPAVGKTIALAILVRGMHEAAERYEADAEAAVAHMTLVRDRIVADAEQLGDPSLDAEVALAEALLVLMQEGAPQGDLYPY